MKKSKRLLVFVLQLLVLVLVGGYLTTALIPSTLASNTGRSPNVIVTINADGSISQKGNLFGDGLLYPAAVEDAERGLGGISGVIRINNQYRNIKISNLGIGLDRDDLQFGNGYPIDMVYSSFLANVRLKVEKGRLFSFDKTLIDYASLRELLYQPGDTNYRGYMLDDRDTITIARGSTVDLKYTLHMVEGAGNELENVTAYMPIYINVHEYTDSADDGEYNPDKGDSGKEHDEVKYQDANDELLVGSAYTEPHWSHDCIITLLNNGVIIGYPHEKYTIVDYFNGTVDLVIYVNEVVLPGKFVIRAEVAALIGRALGLHKEHGDSTAYLDRIPYWARGNVVATTEEGIFEGYPSGMFKPDNYITREEMVAVLIRAFNITLEDESLELPFADKDHIGQWALEYVKAGYENGIIEGYPDNTFRPKNPITRAETFTIICKLMGWHEEHSQ